MDHDDETTARVVEEILSFVNQRCIDTEGDFVLICRTFDLDDDGALPLLLSPAPTEIFGGADDGKSAPPHFCVDIMELQELFAGIEALEWNPHPKDGEESPYLSIEGCYEDSEGVHHSISLEISSMPVEGDEAETQTHFRHFIGQNGA